jgi:hypothetical protein
MVPSMMTSRIGKRKRKQTRFHQRPSAIALPRRLNSNNGHGLLSCQPHVAVSEGPVAGPLSINPSTTIAGSYANPSTFRFLSLDLIKASAPSLCPQFYKQFLSQSGARVLDRVLVFGVIARRDWTTHLFAQSIDFA